MTIKEFRNKITEAEDVNWFNNLKETFNFSYIDFKQEFTGITTIYEFIIKQIEDWENHKDKLPDELNDSIKYFVNIKNLILSFIKSNLKQSNTYLTSNWINIKNQIADTNKKPIIYNTPQAKFLIKVNSDTPKYFKGAYKLLLGIDNNTNLNIRDNFFGAILAYEFTLKDISEITQRRKLEQSSISKLRNDFQNYLSKSETQLIDHLNNANEKFNEYTFYIDKLKEEKETLFNVWFDKTKIEDWEKWFGTAKENIKKIEETYESKLKLEKPAQYWQKKSTRYYEQGTKARNILLWIIGSSSLFLALILTIAPEWIFTNVFKGNTAAVVRWSLVFITLISLIAFGVRIISRIMLSSFHLARDAEERHTLTFFYLALLKDTEIKDKDRELILQSLFSRADTGLLKEDSSPTMPNDILSKIMTKS